MPRLFTLAILLVGVVVAMPAAAAQTAPAVDIAPRVAGRDALAVSLTEVPGAVSVTVADAAGGVAGWNFPADPSASRALAIDIAAPATGTEPANGITTVTVVAAEIVLHEAQVVLDRGPDAPVLSATVSGSRVDASWGTVSGPGVVTYRLERSSGDAAWSVLAETADATTYADRGLAPGAYRYRLTAAVAGAEGQRNWSPASLAGAAVTPPGDASEDEVKNPPKEPAPRENGAIGQSPRRPQRSEDDKVPAAKRRVAAAGAVTRGIAERRGARRPAATRQYSDPPSFGGLRTQAFLLQRAPDPRVAAALPTEDAPPPAVGRPDGAPAVAPTVPTSAPLVVVTGAAAAGSLPGATTGAAGLVVLLLAAHLAAWRRVFSPAAADPR